MRKLIVAIAVISGLSGCGSDGIPVTVETPGLDNLVNTVSEIAENSGVTTTSNNDNTSNSNGETVVTSPEQIARPEIVENYQYKCHSFTNPTRIWNWTLRPELKIADQYGVEVGRWDWIDNLTLLIKPTGNEQVLASLDESTGTLFLESWGQCNSDSEIQIAEQFTRPDAG